MTEIANAYMQFGLGTAMLGLAFLTIKTAIKKDTK